MPEVILSAVTADAAAPLLPVPFETPDEMLLFIAVVVFFVLPAIVFAIVAGVVTSQKKDSQNGTDDGSSEQTLP